MRNAKQKAALFGLILISAAARDSRGNRTLQLSWSYWGQIGGRGEGTRRQTLAAEPPRVLELLKRTDAPALTLTDSFPCVFESLAESDPPQLGRCWLPTTPAGPVDRFDADLHGGHFILRQSDLYLSETFDVPLTRTYNSGDFTHPNQVHAFGRNANHPYELSFSKTATFLIFPASSALTKN